MHHVSVPVEEVALLACQYFERKKKAEGQKKGRGQRKTYYKVNIRRLHRVHALEIVEAVQGAADAGGDGRQVNETLDGGDVFSLFGCA